MEGSLLCIESNDINKKRKTADLVLNDLLDYNNKSSRNKYFTNLTVLILVPNGKNKFNNIYYFKGLVSIIIGAKGKQINYLIRDTKAKIIVDQRIHSRR